MQMGRSTGERKLAGEGREPSARAIDRQGTGRIDGCADGVNPSLDEFGLIVRRRRQWPD